ncbi:MAG: glutamine-hydrolyzing carbamoyl-phosphate synthase small subunit [Candidatus Aenigmatarchaeota archaeon]
MEVKNLRKAYLILEDGSIFSGFGFGAEKTVSGEVVFNTGMVGYTEAITDPSYKGQILCQTYPMIGNYGVSPEDFESDNIKIEGYIVREVCEKPNHWKNNITLYEFLMKNDVPGIYGIDTRMLTKKLRSKGVMLGILTNFEDKEILMKKLSKIEDPNKRDLVREVTINKPIIYDGCEKTIVVIDCGVKLSIIKSLIKRKSNVIRVPAFFTADEIMRFNPDGIIISNGPGDPKKIEYVINSVRDLTEYKIPIMGICLGNQIIALAFGGDTYKLKFGHRGQNHPCMDLRTKKCYITTQNHGFTINSKSLNELEISFVNLNDMTIEGVQHKKFPIFGVQFHPEGAPGPYDTEFLFDKFMKMIVYAK